MSKVKINFVGVWAGTLILLLAVDGICDGVSFTFSTGSIEKSLQTFGMQVFSWVSGIMATGMFLIAFWMIVEGYMNKNLGQKWFAIIGIAIFGILLAAFPKLFSIFSRAAAGVSVG